MEDDPIANQIKAFYQEQRLSDESIERIDKTSRRGKNLLLRLTIPISIAAAALIVFLFNPWKADVTERAFMEVAMHHEMDTPSDFPTTNLAAAESALSNLNFPLSPAPKELQNIQLSGARYCSVLGHPAAQLKLLRNAKPGTLYIVKISGDLKKLQEKTETQSNVNVQCWLTKDGRAFLLAD